MPSKVLDDMARDAGVSKDQAEEYWKKAKKIAEEEFGPSSKDGYWPYTMGIVKRMMGIAKMRARVEARLAAYAQTK